MLIAAIVVTVIIAILNCMHELHNECTDKAIFENDATNAKKKTVAFWNKFQEILFIPKHFWCFPIAVHVWV